MFFDTITTRRGQAGSGSLKAKPGAAGLAAIYAMSKKSNAKVVDFCAYQAKAEAKLARRAEPTVREFYHAFERELALGSRFFLVSRDGAHITGLFDPKAIILIYVRTSGCYSFGKLAIMPAPERRHIFKEVEET